jgi:ankyrin repeat protein
MAALAVWWPVAAAAQIAPSPQEIAAYRGLHAAAARGDVAEIGRLATNRADLDTRDAHGRTALIDAGANVNALDGQAYDIITIAAVADDLPMLALAIASSGNARAITSPYKGTALIAAAHLGHAEVVAALIAAKAPLDHVNNLGWTALIEAIVLGDGGARHQATVAALIRGGANLDLADRQGARPLALARARGYTAIADMLAKAGAKP